MSNIDKITANQQLFTELTPEEGAVVEGGAANLKISLEHFKSEENDPVIYVGGKKVTGKWNVNQNTVVFSDLNVSFRDNTSIILFDQDGGGAQNHDLLMFQNVDESLKGQGLKTKEALGYRLSYEVI